MAHSTSYISTYILIFSSYIKVSLKWNDNQWLLWAVKSSCEKLREKKGNCKQSCHCSSINPFLLSSSTWQSQDRQVSGGGWGPERHHWATIQLVHSSQLLLPGAPDWIWTERRRSGTRKLTVKQSVVTSFMLSVTFGFLIAFPISL